MNEKLDTLKKIPKFAMIKLVKIPDFERLKKKSFYSRTPHSVIIRRSGMKKGAGGQIMKTEEENRPYSTFEELLSDQARNYPDHTALIEMRGTVTRSVSYETLYKAVHVLVEDPAFPVPEYIRIPKEKSIDAIIELLAQTLRCDKFVFYTSGTTSSARGVVLSQKAVLRSAWNGEQMMHAGPEDVLLSMLPLNHIFGFVCTFVWPLAGGSAIALGRGMRHLIDDPRTFDPTILPVVPSLLKFLWQTGNLNPKLKSILVGAGPASREILEAVEKKGIDVRFGYGLTETASGLAISLSGEDPYAMALCPDTEIRIGSEGEIFVRTPCMMEGYLNDPEHTNEKLRNGELDTGDLGFFDAEGRLHVTGRRDDVLVFPNGEKVFLSEWEEKLSALLHTEVMLGQKDGFLTLLAVAHEEGREKILEAVDTFNKNQPIGRKIQHVLLKNHPFPRTATGKLQRWKIWSEP